MYVWVRLGLDVEYHLDGMKSGDWDDIQDVHLDLSLECRSRSWIVQVAWRGKLS